VVTNQDGLGTVVFRKIRFGQQNFILRAFENEGVLFDDIFCRPLFPEDNAYTQAKNGHVDKIY
jgi:imidazoleglycerol-phosphate dehydratase/histidinol-phosphatase